MPAPLDGYQIERPRFYFLTTEDSGKRRKFRTLKEAFTVARQIVDSHPAEVVTIYQAHMEVRKVDRARTGER